MALHFLQPSWTACCSVALDSESRDISLNRLAVNTVEVKEGLLVVDVANKRPIRLVDNAVDVGAAGSDVLETGGFDRAVLDEHGVGEDVEEGICNAVGGDGADGVGARDVVGELDGEERCRGCGTRVGKGRAGEGEG